MNFSMLGLSPMGICFPILPLTSWAVPFAYLVLLFLFCFCLETYLSHNADNKQTGMNDPVTDPLLPTSILASLLFPKFLINMKDRVICL